MATSIDNRQLICRDTLPEILATSNIATDALLRAVDKELTPMFKLSASSPASLVVTVGANKIQNPTSTQWKTITPLAGNELAMASVTGTITFQGNNQNILISNGSPVLLNIINDYDYVKVLVGITSSKVIIVTLGAQYADETAALPVEPVNTISIGYIIVRRVGSTISNVTNNNIFTFNSNKYLPLGNIVGTNDSQNLTSKTLTSVIM